MPALLELYIIFMGLIKIIDADTLLANRHSTCVLL